MGSEGGRRVSGLLRALALFGVLAGALVFAGAAGAAGWRWSKPISLPGANQGISSISCPSAHLCLAAAAVGNPETNGTNDIFWTTNPTGGRSSWHHVALERSVQPDIGGSEEELITGVSCGTAGPAFHCGATDGFANYWQTGAPTTGVWNPQIPTSTGLIGLSCWSAWCAMLDSNSTVVVEVGATTENSTTNVLGTPELLSEGSIGCDTVMFCAAVDVSHKIAWTTDATDPSPDWHHANVGGGGDLDRIACPTAHLCVATEGEESFKPGLGVWHPGAGNWKSVKLPAKLDQSVYDVACASGSFCAISGSKGGVAGPGFVLTSTHPSASVGAWKRSGVPIKDPSVISCPTASECMIGDGQGGKISVGRK
jgi:hypothetical protein